MRRATAILTAIVLLPAVLSGCGSSESAPNGTSQSGAKQASSLQGTWKADGFEAKIGDNSIEINIVGNDTRSLYWKGTFPAGSDSVKSLADKEALSASMLGSQDSEKVFTVKGDQIDFEMSIAGTTRTVHLKK